MSERKEQRPIPPEPAHPCAVSRKPYDGPRLIEWGSLIELTKGPISGLDDLPLDGGTTFE
jgi:hypothetical protein